MGNAPIFESFPKLGHLCNENYHGNLAGQNFNTTFVVVDFVSNGLMWAFMVRRSFSPHAVQRCIAMLGVNEQGQ